MSTSIPIGYGTDHRKALVAQFNGVKEHVERLRKELTSLEKRKEELASLIVETPEETLSRFVSESVSVSTYDAWYYIYMGDVYYFPSEDLAKKHMGARGASINYLSTTCTHLRRLLKDKNNHLITEVLQ
jgi:hypothetical protein